MNLFVSFSCACSACATSGRLKRDRMLMMCMRAIGSLPSSAADQLGHQALVGDLADDAEQRGLLGRLLVVGAAAAARATLRRDFCAAMTPTIGLFGICGSSSSAKQEVGG